MKTQVRSSQLGDAEVKRADLNVTESGQAVIRKVIAGEGIILQSTGIDPGTGDVTITSTGGGTALSISALPEKTDLEHGDLFVIEDSEDSFLKKKVTFATLLEMFYGVIIDGGGAYTNSTNFIDGEYAGSVVTNFMDGGFAQGIYTDMILDGGGA